MKDFKINVGKGRLKKRLSELDLNELQEMIKEKVDSDLEAISISAEDDEITGIILHRKDDTEVRFDLQPILDFIEEQVNPFETVSDVLERSKEKSINERLDAMEQVLTNFSDLKIKKKGEKNEREDIL